jgi:hypothetical protein
MFLIFQLVSFAMAQADTLASTALGTSATTQTTCGPPAYPCARTDLLVEQLPSTIPSVGGLNGAGTLVRDPDFGTNIIRVTDVDTDPAMQTCARLHTYCNTSFVTAGGGSAWANVWNTSDTLFQVTSTMGYTYIMGWDPASLRLSRPFSNVSPGTGGLRFAFTGMQWSRINPNLIYVVRGTKLLKYDLTNRYVLPVAKVLYDFTWGGKCLPVGFKATWQSVMNVGAGDQTFSVAFSNAGGQETGVYVAVYKVGSGCSLLNTATGKVTGNWGQSGIINIPYRFKLHEANGSLNNARITLTYTAQSCTSSAPCPNVPAFWQAGTTNVQTCPAGSLCSGHWVNGFNRWLNNDGDPVHGASHSRPYTNLSAITLLTRVGNIAPVIPPFDQHLSWNNNKGADTIPFYATTTAITTSGIPVYPFPAAWYNEGIIVPMDGSPVRREHHTLVTGRNQRFSAKMGIGQISQTGRFAVFTSDWMNRLGCENGSPGPCTVGNTLGRGYRADVFVVELK